MSKILFGVIGVLVLLCSFLYWQNSNLSALNDAFELRDAEQKAVIENLQNDFELQTSSLLKLQEKNQEIEAEMVRYLDIFKRHNLSKLAIAKPGLIETRVNNGTKDVFDSIEKDTIGIDDLDNGLQLQPTTE
jgi:hypothetical protein|tara:strand:+ start:57 stop:452 length:396 start_codon:yes stop_codon:yes gene_type:complete